MKLLLLKNDSIIKFNLPKKIEGSIWISDVQNNNTINIITVEARNESWNLISNNDFSAVVNNELSSSVSLIPNNLYTIKSLTSDYNDYFVFLEDDFFNDLSFYDVSTVLKTGITIGNNSNFIINYQKDIVNYNHAVISSDGYNLIINAFDTVYVNENKVQKSYLNFGDVIFIYGLKMIFVKNNDRIILCINNPENKVTCILQKSELYYEEENINYEEPKEEKEILFYSKGDYFYKKPRYIYQIKPLNFKVDEPPQKNDNEKIPAILTLGPMLTMSLTSVMTIYTTITNIQKGVQTLKEARPSLIISGAMMVSFLVWPMLTNVFQKHIEKKNEKKRQKKYTNYIESLKTKIVTEKTNQEELLKKSFVSLEECEKIILDKSDRLWERRPEDSDFLVISVGNGNTKMMIEESYPENHFSMVEDNLIDKANELKNAKKILENVPIAYSFKENYISAAIGDSNLQYQFARSIILQLITFHSYDNLKIVILTSKDKEKNLENEKNLPHIFSNNRNFRFFASSQDEYKEIFYNLEKIFNQREELSKNNQNMSFDQNFVIITDSFESIRNYEFITKFIVQKNYLGFSMLILNDNISDLPDQCQTFIELSNNQNNLSKIFKNISNSEEQYFNIYQNNVNTLNCYTKLLNIPIETTNDEEGIIPKKVGFLELLNLGKIEQINCKMRWRENTPILNMSVPVGIGKNGDVISLDIHEKYHGPHGLVAGMTGSGKSEFLITYILSLAINYHPYEVQFVLIDYKGGGLAGAFENKTLGYKLPHLVGVITNLDKTEINRSFASIESELKRRQALFNIAREKSGESTIDIYKYQKMYREHIVDEPISHLIIIADEFAELKQQQPEFMEQLISTARIGRSLGVHLILATQKPGGIVDAQIWSNTRFRACFRVQEKSDSQDVIQCPDAAYLTQTGRFYLQVGYNEIFVLGQSAWSGGKYIPRDTVKKDLDTDINFINNIGYVYKNEKTQEESVSTVKLGEELTNVVKYLSDSANEESLISKPLWLDKIPNEIYILDLIKKYNYKVDNSELNPAIGEYDIPDMQTQNLLTVPFSTSGSALVYGIAGSGKENFISTLIFSTMAMYTPEQANFYIIDCGAETLKIFNNSPLVGDVIYLNDVEKMNNLINFINDTINERKNLFSDYNGDMKTYISKTGNVIPNIVIVINNFEAFYDTYSELEESLAIITRDSIKYGIYFLVTASTTNGVRYRIKQNFGQIFCLGQNSEDDFVSILGNVNKTYPSKNFGRGIFKTDKTYEFQTALISEKEKIFDTINLLSDKLNSAYKTKAKHIPILPDIVIYDELENDSLKGTKIGINKENLLVSKYDFTQNNINIVSTTDITLFDNFINPFLYSLSDSNSYNTIVINASNLYLEDEIINRCKCINDCNEAFSLVSSLNQVIEKTYIENNKNKSVFDDKKKYYIVIIGINNFKINLNEENQNNFNELFKLLELNMLKFIIIDDFNSIKNFEYEEWYKNNTNNADFIWLGNGLVDQYTLSVTNSIPELKIEIPYNFCFVTKHGKTSYVKFTEKIHK